jgi:hypothetical protein
MAITKVTRTLLSTGIDDQSNATAIIINSSEQVGIGGSPDAMLKVTHTIDSETAIFENARTANNGTDSVDVRIRSVNRFANLFITSKNVRSSAIKFGDEDADSIGQLIYDNSNDSMQFVTNTAEAMRIDSSGNVGINTSSPATSLHIANAGNSFLTLERTGTTGGTGTFAINMEGGSSQQTTMAYDDGGKLVIGRSSDPATQAGFSNDFVLDSSGKVGIGATSIDGDSLLHLKSSKPNIFFEDTDDNKDWRLEATSVFKLQDVTRGAEVFRFDGSGNLLVGTTTQGGKVTIDSPSNDGLSVSVGSNRLVMISKRGNDGDHIRFLNSAGTISGNISVSGTSTAYGTSSDYRLKENVDYDFTALDRVAQLKPARFNFIADADKTVDGFLAHEVQDIVPEAISGEKDAVDDEGNPEYQGIDQGKLVPLLTKAIQEQQTQIEALQSEINLLKGE